MVYISILLSIWCGRRSSVSIVTRYRLGGTGLDLQWGARFSVTVQIGPWAYLASGTNGYRALPGDIPAGA